MSELLKDRRVRLEHFLAHQAELRPGAVALVCGDSHLSYGQMWRDAVVIAAALREHGIVEGDRVVIALRSNPALATCIYGVLAAGAAFVVVDDGTKTARLLQILENSGAAALIAEGRCINDLQLHIRRNVAGCLRVVIANGNDSVKAGVIESHTLCEVLRGAVATAKRWQDPDYLACLIYTSGSTGEPKGVMSSHANAVFAASSIVAYLENDEHDRIINVLPLSFDYGLYQLLMVVICGGTLVLEQSFAFPLMTLQRIVEERVTGLPGVPMIFSLLLKADLGSCDLSSIRYITNTAAALSEGHIKELRAAFPWAKLYSMYGLTETKRTLFLPSDQLDEHPASVGIAIPGTEVWLIDGEGKRLGPGSSGELVVRGPHVMLGYWRNGGATADRFRPGSEGGERVCYTGDLFRMDAEGYFYFLGRKDDLINTRGQKVSPRAVEGLLRSLPGVCDVAVVGVPDLILGQAVKAVVVPEGNLSVSDILAYCRNHMEPFMVPKYVEFLDKLPRTRSGKVAKKELEKCAG